MLLTAQGGAGVNGLQTTGRKAQGRTYRQPATATPTRTAFHELPSAQGKVIAHSVQDKEESNPVARRIRLEPTRAGRITMKAGRKE